MPLDAWFRDAITGSGRWELSEVRYRSEAGNLLEVSHDLEALRALRSPETWRQTWDASFGKGLPPASSGIWSKQELVLPQLPREHIVSLGEGCTPLLPSPLLAQDLDIGQLLIKQCGTAHSGSFKDLGMTVLVSQVNHIIKTGAAELLGVACASTGDTSAALAAYCAHAGIPAVVLIPTGKISAAQLVQPMSNYALTLSLDTDFDGCMRLVRELTEDRRLYLANSMNSLRIEGQKTVAIEIVQQLGWELPDWILIPGGNLGNVSALYKGLEEIQALGLITRMPRIVCCQAAAADPLYRSFRKNWADFEAITAQPTLASAIRIGDPVSRPKAIAALRRHDGLVEHASEQELAHAMAQADRRGLFTCPHTGVALACLARLRAAGTIGAADRVVVVSTAHGLKFAETKAGYHQQQLPGISAELANPPLPLAATREAIYDAVNRHFDAVAG